MSTVDFHSTTHGPEDGTLDLTKLKLTIGQLVVFVALVSGPIAGTAVSLYQLSEVRKAQDAAASSAVITAADTAKRLAALEADKKFREGIEYGRANPEQKGGTP